MGESIKQRRKSIAYDLSKYYRIKNGFSKWEDEIEKLESLLEKIKETEGLGKSETYIKKKMEDLDNKMFDGLKFMETVESMMRPLEVREVTIIEYKFSRYKHFEPISKELGISVSTCKTLYAKALDIMWGEKNLI